MLNYDMELSDNNLLKTGTEFRQQEGRLLAGPVYMVHDGWKISDISVFALDKHNFTDKLSGVAGARYSNDEISGNVFVPRAGIEYQINEVISTKALYSKGFRAPYLNELYLVPSRNKDLKAEEVNNYEIGLSAKSYDFNFDITAFIMNGDNIIENNGGQLQNTGKYEFKGCELGMGYVFNKYLNAGLGYTYFDAGINTQGRPGNKIDGDVNFKIDKFTLNTTAMYMSEYYAGNNKQNKLDDFTVLNARLSYEVNETVKLFVEGQNLTNQKYYMFLDRDGGKIMEMPCTTFTVGTKVKF
ncbi:MAG: TonB-dependent receptor, partial [Endomicrobiaceae bacterium]|nr:TonB-dependent receptor [Endomicrobiaceae bacterium]